MSITPMPPAKAKGARFEHGQFPAEKFVPPRSTLSENQQANGGDRQMVKILAAALTDGMPEVEAACAQALSEGVHSADVVLNILARRRDPGRPRPS